MLYSFDGTAPQISEKAYISDSATIIGDVTIEDDCYVGPGAILRGDEGSIHIGEGTAVEDGVIIHAGEDGVVCRVGSRVILGHGALIHGNVNDNAVIGMGALVSIGATVGEYAIVGEGAVVKMFQAIEPRMVAVGNPAKIARPLEERDTIIWDYSKQSYIELARKCLSGSITPIVS